MPLKDILVAFSNGTTSENVLKFALALSDQARAKITAIHVTPPITEQNQILAWMPEKLMTQIQQANKLAPAKAKEALDRNLAKFERAATTSWVIDSGDISNCLATHSRLHDLLVVGKYSETTEESGAHVRAEQIVTRSGRPLIVVPRKWCVSGPLSRVVIAWDGGPTATRALSDAMHLLPFVEHIEVVTVAKANADSSATKTLQENLRLHNPNISMNVLRSTENTAAQILDHARESRANLLVIGSRGSARLRSGLVHGGTGRTIMGTAEIPVLISH